MGREVKLALDLREALGVAGEIEPGEGKPLFVHRVEEEGQSLRGKDPASDQGVLAFPFPFLEEGKAVTSFNEDRERSIVDVEVEIAAEKGMAAFD